MTEVVSQLVAFFLGIAASFAFWYFLLVVKPKVQIAPFATYEPLEDRLRIKIINRGRRQVTDLQATLTITEQRLVQGGFRLINVHNLPLIREELFALGSVRDYGKPWSLYPIYIFSSKQAGAALKMMESSGTDERRLVFTLSATDSLSNTKMIQRVSYAPVDIKEGKFDIGLRFAAIETPIAPVPKTTKT